MAERIRGEHGGMLLSYRGFRYEKKKTQGGKDYHQCKEEGCLVTLHTQAGTLVVLQNRGVHHHNPPGDVIAATRVIDEAKRMIDQDPTRHLPRIWEETLDWYEQNHNHRWMLPDFYEVKSSLYRHRNIALPPLPGVIDDIDFNAINPVWRTTSRGTQFMLKHDTNYGITIFSTVEQIELLSQARFLLADGTFKTAPPPYQQLYTFHAIRNNRRVPVVFALMMNKATADYIRLLELIKRYVYRATRRDLDPNMIITDYELGMINAVAAQLPNTTHGGCLFHFNQCIYKKVLNFGLVDAYRNDDRVTLFVRRIMALPFLPILLLRMNFDLHLQRNQRLIRRYPALTRLINYVQQTWLNGPYPLALWNVYNRPLPLRTTNTCEGWHHRWNGRVAKIHPNIWIFVTCLKREEKVIHRVIRKIRGNRPPPPQIRRYRMLNELINQYKTEYERNIKTLDEYWEAIQYVCHEF